MSFAKRLLTLVLILLATSACKHKSEYAPDAIVRGPGASSCGEYTGDVGNPYYIAWTMGYLSGVNVVKHASGDPYFEVPDKNSIAVYLRNYCNKNPLKHVLDAAKAMNNDLMKN